MNRNFTALSILIGATIGAGIFALPFVVQSSGWGISLAYGLALGWIMASVHVLYMRVLETTGEKGNFIRLSGKYFGKLLRYSSIFVTIGNIIFALLIYLVLGGGFLRQVFGLPFNYAVLIFWAGVSLPLLFKKKFFLEIEEWGTVFVMSLIFIVGWKIFDNPNFSVVFANSAAWFRPFGPIIFALAGWTALEPVARLTNNFPRKKQIIFLGMGAVLLLYAIFTFGVLSHGGMVSQDTVSGLGGGAALFMAVIGAVTVWRAYLALGDEMKRVMENFSKSGIWIAVFLPIFMIFLGFRNLMGLVQVAGGIFLSLQYLLILVLSRKVLKPKGIKLFFIFLAEIIFLCAAGYTVFSLV